jgi:hypothetical protein
VSRLNSLPIVLFLTIVAGVTLSACGGSNPKLLPGTTATQINANLDEVKQLAEEEDCIGAANAAAAVQEEIDALEGVDAKLKQALVEGAERLNSVVGECEESGLAGEEEAREKAEEAEQAEEEEQEKERKPSKSEKEKEAEEPAEGNEGGKPSQPGGEEEGGEEPPAEEGGESGSGGIGPGTPAGEG